MRVMAYNIYEGGFRAAGDRRHALLDVIRNVDPDMLGLCECTEFDDDNESRLKWFCHMLGMHGVMNPSNSEHHTALLWKPHMRVRATLCAIGNMYHGFCRVRVNTTNFGDITVLMTHLHPFSSCLRLAEAQIVASRALGTGEAILMGDLNSVSPTDARLDRNRMFPALRARLAGPSGDIDTTPIQYLANVGFVDLLAQHSAPTYPTALQGKRDKYGVGLRSDYIFASQRVASSCTQTGVINSDSAECASDHLPVFAEIGIDD